MVSNLLIKRKKNPQPKKASIPKYAKHTLEAKGLVWMQKLDNMSSLLIFLIMSVCKQRHENSKCSMILNLSFSVKGEIIYTGGMAKYLQ